MEQRSRGGLPIELTHFIGRQRELDALRTLAGEARLLTLTGAGGSGKSRLALQLVRQTRDAGDVVWVELAALTDPALLPGAVLRALGAPAEGGTASAEAIVSLLRDRRLLLVLDNCEHLVDACAALVHALLLDCADLRILTTSREALGVTGERAWLVPPLELPAEQASIDALSSCDAVQLFVDRARDVLPDFTLDERNAGDVGRICTRLDGIPLALELAAARVRHMTPRQILERLDDAFGLLTSNARTAIPRHRTLRAAIEWSHDILPEPARIVFRRLAVFRGGFTLDMVAEVVSGAGIPAGDVLDLVTRLADRSMIYVRERRDGVRYQLLETMRQYAGQKLEESGEAGRIRGRLADAVTSLIRELEPRFITRARRAAFATLEPELDNIREVLHWTRDNRPEQHVRLVGMLWWFWYSSRHWVEAHGWIEQALALPEAAAHTRERARLLFAGGALAALRADSEAARPLLEEAAEIAAQQKDDRLEAYATNYLAMTWSAYLSPRALTYAERAGAWFRAHDDPYGLRLALLLGGMALHGAGRADESCVRMEEAVRIARDFGEDRELAIALQTYATVLIGMGRTADAEVLVRESLQALRAEPSFLFVARAIDHYAETCAAADPHRAARLIGVATALRRHIGASRFAHDEDRIGRVVDALKVRLGPEYRRVFDEGLAVKPDAAIHEALGVPAAAAESPLPAEPQAAPASSAPLTAALPVTAPATPLTMPATPNLIVRTLGPFEVRVDGARIGEWAYAKPRELLTLLLLSPKGITRAEVGQALWPDAAPSQVRNSFHVTLHHLRRALGHPEWIELTEERYRLLPSLSVDFDAQRFEEAARRALRGDVDEAAGTGRTARSAPAALDTKARDRDSHIEAIRGIVGLYHDHFLAGESAGVWRDEVQDRLRRLRCDLGMQLANELAQSGDATGAVDEYEAVIGFEPVHEAAHRGLMRMLAITGQRATALRCNERLLALLGDLGLSPEAETVALAEQIRSATVVEA